MIMVTREELEFQSILEFLQSDMARQLDKQRAMEAGGEIPLPPENEN